MRDSQFDDIIRNKLSELNFDSDSPDWDHMEHRLDAVFGSDISEEEDRSFDEQIAKEMADFRMPYNSSHWLQLKQKLELEEYLKTRIYIAKIMELTVLFLIVLTGYNIISYNGFLFEKNDSKETLAEKPIFVEHVNTSNDLNASEINDDKNASDILIAKTIAPEQNLIQKEENRLSIVSNNTIEPTSSKKIQLPAILDILVNGKPATIQTNQNKPENLFAATVSVENNTNSNRNNLSFSEIASLNHLLHYDGQEVQNPPAIDTESIKPLAKQKNTNYINLIASNNINLINSPFDKVYSLESYKTTAQGFSGGITFSTKKKNLEIESGIIYSEKNYNPKKVAESFGRSSGNSHYEITLNEVSFSILSVPLNLKYHFWSGKGWSSFVNLGGSANLIAESNYDTPTEQILPGSISSHQVVDFNGIRLNTKPFNPGIFDGGSFGDNTFVTANLGIGIQKRIVKGFSMFLNPNYSHHITPKGIGPNEDKIHSFSVILGAKMGIN